MSVGSSINEPVTGMNMNTDKPRILVVDDDIIVRTMASHQLTHAGFEVTALGDGRKVVETFQSLRPDAVLLDVVLPDRDGYGICRELRALEGMQHYPIAMLTSLDDEEAIRMAFEAGATEFIPKPLNWVHEIYRLRYMLRTSQMMNELDESRIELVQAQKMESLGVLTAGIAHDFNNLLQGIISYAELIGMGVLKEAECDEAVAEIGKIASRGCSLTSQLLLTSRKDVGMVEDVAVDALLSESVSVLKHTLPKTITTHLNTPSELRMIKADSSHMQQVLINLAINASHAMPDGGDLTIRAENVILDEKFCSRCANCEPGHHVIIEVSDTGHGMDSDTMGKMYEPFFTTKGPQDGTGLGLSVIYGIVKAHHGHISCESAVGKGTTFRLYIPVAEILVEKEEPVVEVSCGGGGGRVILLADDEPNVRYAVGAFLDRDGYRVIKSADGKEALEQFGSSREEIDAIVLDMNMPNMDGEACLKELAGQGCKAPVILATGSLLSSERESELLEYASAIIAKPFERKGLLKVVSDALEAKAY